MLVEAKVSDSVAIKQPSYLAAVAAIVRKDIAAELRSRELLAAMGTFALLVILIFTKNTVKLTDSLQH